MPVAYLILWCNRVYLLFIAIPICLTAFHAHRSRPGLIKLRSILIGRENCGPLLPEIDQVSADERSVGICGPNLGDDLSVRKPPMNHIDYLLLLFIDFGSSLCRVSGRGRRQVVMSGVTMCQMPQIRL